MCRCRSCCHKQQASVLPPLLGDKVGYDNRLGRVVAVTTTIVVAVTTSGEATNKHGQHQSQQAVTLWFVSFKHKF